MKHPELVGVWSLRNSLLPRDFDIFNLWKQENKIIKQIGNNKKGKSMKIGLLGQFDYTILCHCASSVHANI